MTVVRYSDFVMVLCSVNAEVVVTVAVPIIGSMSMLVFPLVSPSAVLKGKAAIIVVAAVVSSALVAAPVGSPMLDES